MHIISCKHLNGKREVYSLHPSQWREIVSLILSCYKRDVYFTHNYIEIGTTGES